MELTKEYFDQQLKALSQRFNKRMDGFATQMSGFATKDDLLELATKDDLLEVATKQDVNRLKAVVDDIQIKVSHIDRRTDEDTRAAFKDILKLRKRIAGLRRN